MQRAQAGLRVAVLGVLLVGLVATAEATPGRAAVQARLRPQVASGGVVRLDLDGLPFGSVTLAEARETPSGQFVGSVGFGSRRALAMFHFVPEAMGSDEGTWLLALRPDRLDFAGLAPHLAGTVVDQLALSEPVLVFAVSGVSAERGLLDADVAAFYGGFARTALEVQAGVHLLTVATPRPGSAVERALALLGLDVPQVNLAGLVLRDFDASALQEASDNGQLKAALLRGTELRAALPALRLDGLPPSFVTGSAYLFVTGEPGIGVGFGMTVRDQHGLRTFACSASIRADEDAVQEVTIVAGTEGEWPDALGIPGFDLDEARLLLSVDTAQRVGFGLRARMGIGTKRVLVAGKVKLHALTGVVTEGSFEGSVDSLGSADLVALASRIGHARGHRGEPLSAGAVPDFRLQDVYLRFAPAGGDARLGIESGVALRGTLFAFDRQLVAVDAVVDQSTLVPTIKVKGEAADIDLGVIALTGAKVDVNLGLTTNPYFRVKGSSRVWISSKTLDVDASRERFSFELDDHVGGVYRARWKARSPARGEPNWLVQVVLQNDFSQTLKRDVSRQALEWASQVERDFARAEADVRRERAAVEGLSRQIEQAKEEVGAARARDLASLQKAEADVRALDAKIAARQSVVDERQAPLRKAAAALKSRRDRAKRTYDAALAARKRARGLDVVAAKAKEAAAWTALQEARVAYDVAHGDLARALARVDPELSGLQAARATAGASLAATREVYERVIVAGPVEMDPKVAGLIAGRETARGALLVAEAAVHVTGKAAAGAARVTAWAAKNNGRVVMLDAASFQAQLAAYARGNKVDLRLEARFLGEPRDVTLQANAEDIARGRVFQSLWKLLERSLD